jgi:hypothetical protein
MPDKRREVARFTSRGFTRSGGGISSVLNAFEDGNQLRGVRNPVVEPGKDLTEL